MKNYNQFVNENNGNFIIGDGLKEILQRLNHPISTTLLHLQNSPIPFIDVSNTDDTLKFGKTSTNVQSMGIGRLINRLFPGQFPPSGRNGDTIESFVDKYKVLFSRKSVKVETKLDDDTITKQLENTTGKYITKLDKSMYQNLRAKYCTTYEKNRVLFYRGDRSLKDDYYLINGKETKTKLQFSFNYITTEFMASELWKEKGYPLKKHSLNMATNTDTTLIFGNDCYAVIPFDGAKIVCLPKLFGNYPSELFKRELGMEFRDPSDMAQYLQDLSKVGNITLGNVNGVMKKLEIIFDNHKINNDKQFDIIVNNMKKHNMSFVEYMNFIFAPENYDIMNYEDMTPDMMAKYAAEYTDSYVLMVKMNKLNEHLTNTGRWGNVGAGILPYCPKTKRFLLSYRSEYVLEPHTWGVWGGKVDDGEDNIQDTAIREFKEEARYNGNINLLPSYIYKERGFTYYNFIGVIDHEFNPNLNWLNEYDQIETEDYKWVTFDELIKINPKHFGLVALIQNNSKQLSEL